VRKNTSCEGLGLYGRNETQGNDNANYIGPHLQIKIYICNNL
jgi:hypothetical protein